MSGVGGTAKLQAGVPRFRELINATEDISTPCMTLQGEPVLLKHMRVADTMALTSAPIPREFYDAHAKYHKIEALKQPRTVFAVDRSKSTWCTYLEIKRAIYQACEDPVVSNVSTSPEWIFDVSAADFGRVKDATIGGIKGVRAQHYSRGVSKTEGVSDLASALEFDACATTNDVMDTLKVLGVEAAARVLYSEMKSTLDRACYVAPRHVQLLVDTMSRSGGIVAASRHGMSATKKPVLQRASFEVIPLFGIARKL